MALAEDEAPKVAGSEVPVPKRLKFVAPEYPAEAQARGLRGIVILDLIIDPEGSVRAVEVTRSVPPFDEAAVAAVRQWEYEPTKIGGRPVSVRLTVPITFALKLPDMKRESGIPELRQGAAPGVPASDAPGNHSVLAELTIDGNGQLVEGGVVEGETPWAEALLLAVRTWRFAPTTDGEPLRFKLKAEFAPAQGPDKPARVGLELSEPKRLASQSFRALASARAAAARGSALPAPAPQEAQASPRRRRLLPPSTRPGAACSRDRSDLACAAAASAPGPEGSASAVRDV
jgi:TonB family protein